ncbi:uncharacterized protein [Drosophila tropicalis]|uniref:uncharacterized protein n=1 Tax=Drosophila tropicalis TaxID=46794 RepID=UPI0035ABC8E7
MPAKTEYDAVIQEYLDLGNMRQVPFDGSNNNFYLPHHAVFKPDSNTTKVRVVFNASSKSTNGMILFRYKEGQLVDYELNTVTFGINCALFLAIRGLTKKQRHSQWSMNFKTLLKSVLSCIPKCHLQNADFLDIEKASTAKTLGIRSKATTDEFYFVISPQDIKSAYTKREVRGQIAKLFDPADWLAPFVIQAKVFMQEHWLQKLGWDDQLPSELHHRLQDFTKSYYFLDHLRIPRWVLHDPNSDILLELESRPFRGQSSRSP